MLASGGQSLDELRGAELRAKCVCPVLLEEWKREGSTMD